MPPTKQFTVNVNWNGTVVQVSPDPVPAYQGRNSGENVQITWRPSNGTFGSNAFSWKPGSNPNWSPTLTNGNLVSPVYNPLSEGDLYYNITITDSSGTPHTLDPEIQNVPPGTGVDPSVPPGQIGKPAGQGNQGNQGDQGNQGNKGNQGNQGN